MDSYENFSQTGGVSLATYMSPTAEARSAAEPSRASTAERSPDVLATTSAPPARRGEDDDSGAAWLPVEDDATALDVVGRVEINHRMAQGQGHISVDWVASTPWPRRGSSVGRVANISARAPRRRRDRSLISTQAVGRCVARMSLFDARSGAARR